MSERKLRAEGPRARWLVALLVPEALDEGDLEAIGAMLAKSPTPARALVSVSAPTRLPIAAALEASHIPAQWLLGPDGERASIARMARELGKAVLAPDDRLPALAGAPRVADGLDPEARGGPWRWPFLRGRFEQALLELFAFSWRGRADGGVSRSLKDLRQCVGRDWRPKAFFAPPAWSEHDLDREGPVRERFEILDRSAVFGSRIQRDIIWFVHLCAAFAVFAAVAGVIFNRRATFFGVVEFVDLAVIIGLIIKSRRFNLQEKWTACRLGAEQLRIVRMCLPLLALPAALLTRDASVAPIPEPLSWWVFWRWPTLETVDLTEAALAEVKRAVRDQGLPTAIPADARRAAAWLRVIVADQAAYHDNNARKLQRAERVFRFLTTALFMLALAAVLAELILREEWLPGRWTGWLGEGEWLLFLTAVGPAFAASLQGAETRLGIVHRAALSEDTAERLARIDAALGAIVEAPRERVAAMETVRDLALDAAEAMGSENVSWHALLRRERDTLPA
jgi:hypothetical protein